MPAFTVDVLPEELERVKQLAKQQLPYPITLGELVRRALNSQHPELQLTLNRERGRPRKEERGG